MTNSRQTYADCWYHIMNRGHSKRHIFLNDHQRHYFLKILETATDKFNLKIHAYCLMGNHYHLLIHTIENNLSDAMQFINMHHARQFNKARKRDGAVFRGRFKSIVIKDDLYRMNVCRYIHRNPVEAGIVSNCEEYFWSSCKDYYGQKNYTWLETDYLLNLEPDHLEYLQKGNSEKIKEIYSKLKLARSLGRDQDD